LLNPKPFLAIMPPFIPAPGLMVAASGLAEILGGLGIALTRTRPVARWGLALLLVAVFPANVYMAWKHIEPTGIRIPALLLWARLPLQPLLICWLLLATNAPVKTNLKPGNQAADECVPSD
jgi:uncharacterized membrane protein